VLVLNRPSNLAGWYRRGEEGLFLSPELAFRSGTTLVHFSAQPESFLTLNTSPKRVNTPSTPASTTP